MKLSTIAFAVLAAAVASASQAATFNPFIIRQANTQPAVTPVFITDIGGVVTTQIDEGGEKTGYGTNFYDGQTVSNLTQVNYTRLDAGDKDPYVNIWVTDNAGHFAVVAPVVGMNNTGNYTGGNDVAGQNLLSLGFNIYETDFNNLSWLGVAGAQRVNQAVIAGGSGGTVVTLGDIAGLTILDPGVYPNPPIGTGAPKNGTGFNLIFGDTQTNLTQAVPYMISNVNVPEPTTLAALGAASLLGLGRRRRA